jgi:hypothetical protein
MSPENIRATSSITIEKAQVGVGELIREIAAGQVAAVSVGIFVLLSLLIGVCLLLLLAGVLKKKSITLLTERRY